MNMTLNLSTNNGYGALERILAVVRYRGYQLLNVQADSSDTKNMAVAMTVSHPSGNEHLLHHLRKLRDVQSAEMKAAPPIRIKEAS